MRILDLHIDGFGKFHDLSVSFDKDLNVVYGKTRPENPPCTLHPLHALRTGAWTRTQPARTFTANMSHGRTRPSTAAGCD